jgi:hypothetical protein
MWHHLPEIESTPAAPNFEPRSEWFEPPPILPDELPDWFKCFENNPEEYSATPIVDQLSTGFFSAFFEWWSQFLSELVHLGNKLQKHVCRPVCHRYGHTDDCHFLFLHELIESLSFDAETNSFILCCLQPFINWYNPYILVCGRHNHNLKCILSGKAAKAAMFYISNYITKFDEKIYHILSLLSQAVVANKNILDSNVGLLAAIKGLFHKYFS